MTNANNETLGKGVVVESAEHVTTTTPKRMKLYLIFAGVILAFLSSFVTMTLIKGKSPDVAAVSQPAGSGEVVRTQSGLTLILGPFSEKEMCDIAVAGLSPILKNKTYDSNIMKKTTFNEPSSSAKYLGTENGVDSNGVKRAIHIVEVYIAGKYFSDLHNSDKEFNAKFVAHVYKTDYGRGFKILNTELMNYETIY